MIVCKSLTAGTEKFPVFVLFQSETNSQLNYTGANELKGKKISWYIYSIILSAITVRGTLEKYPVCMPRQSLKSNHLDLNTLTSNCLQVLKSFRT